MKQQEQQKKVKGKELGSIPESSSKKDFHLDPTLKVDAGKTTFQYNKRAHKKYSSTRSLVDRILKSHSEGNRFIKNADL